MARILLAILAASTFLAVPVHAENLILNGSFESPAIAANTSSPTSPVSWLGMQPNLSIINGDYSPGYPLPQQGQQYAFLGHDAVLTQGFIVSNPGNYVLNWFDSTEFNGPGNLSPYTVIVSDGANNVVKSSNFNANAIGLRVWQNRSMELTLPADSYTLRFEGHVAMSGEGTMVDNVSLAVPEPSSIVFGLLAGVGLLVARFWRR